jgi:hypothetical protein
MILHLLPPLALSAIQLDGDAPERGGVLGRIKPEPAQRGFPANRAANGIHRQRACEQARGIGVCLWRRFGRVV